MKLVLSIDYYCREYRVISQELGKPQQRILCVSPDHSDCLFYLSNADRCIDPTIFQRVKRDLSTKFAIIIYETVGAVYEGANNN